MKLSKGQRHTLALMHVDPDEYDPTTLTRFFAWTDRGNKDIFTEFDGSHLVGYFVNVDDGEALGELYERFQWLGMREGMWAVGFAEGTLWMSDFADETDAELLAVVARARAKGKQMNAEGYPNLMHDCILHLLEARDDRTD